MKLWVNRMPVGLSDGSPIEVPDDVVLVNVRNRQHDMSPRSMRKAQSLLSFRGVMLGERGLADVLFIPSRLWSSGEMRGLFDVELDVVPAKRYNGKPRIIAKINGEQIADISAQESCYITMAILSNRAGMVKMWIEPTEFDKVLVIPIIFEGEGGIRMADVSEEYR